MKLRCIIYSTDRTFWFKRDFGIIKQTIMRGKGIEGIDFDVRYFPPPLTIPTVTDYIGNVKPNWGWFRQRFPANGHNVVVFHTTQKHAKRWGIKGMNGSYSDDPDEVFEFFMVASQGENATGYTKSRFWQLFCHELSHGFFRWTAKYDPTHDYDYTYKDDPARNVYKLEDLFLLVDFTKWDLLAKKRNYLVRLLEKLRKKYG